MNSHETTLTAGTLTVRLTLRDDHLVAVQLPAQIPAGLTGEMLAALEKTLRGFPLGLPSAPPFTQRVWEVMRQIPFGSTLTYRELATRAGNPLAARAIGNACAANRLLLAIPCHRVVATHGLGGFGPGLAWKQKLLELEHLPTEALTPK